MLLTSTRHLLGPRHAFVDPMSSASGVGPFIKVDWRPSFHRTASNNAGYRPAKVASRFAYLPLGLPTHLHQDRWRRTHAIAMPRTITIASVQGQEWVVGNEGHFTSGTTIQALTSAVKDMNCLVNVNVQQALLALSRRTVTLRVRDSFASARMPSRSDNPPKRDHSMRTTTQMSHPMQRRNLTSQLNGLPSFAVASIKGNIFSDEDYNARTL